MTFLSFLFDRKFRFFEHISFMLLGAFIVTDIKLCIYPLIASLLFDLLYSICLYKRSKRTQ